MENIEIKCQDCGKKFIFSVNEQTFYNEKGLVQPKRCRYCRRERKNKRIN